MKIAGAIFDMDGVLFDTQRVYQEIWQEIADERGIVLADNFTERISGSSGEEAFQTIRENYHVEDVSVIDSVIMDRMKKRMEACVPIKPGVIETLQFLHDKGIKIAVASGTGRDQILFNLKKAGIDSFFDAVVGGTELIYGKPRPNIFLLAAEKMGCDSTECYVIEDSKNGILAASAAGCVPIFIPDLIAPTAEIKQLSYVVCKDMYEALEIMKKDITEQG